MPKEENNCLNCHFCQQGWESSLYCLKGHKPVILSGTACKFFIDKGSSHKHKQDFINELKVLYMDKGKNSIGMTDMQYQRTSGGEYVVVWFGNSKKRFSIYCDNEQGILIDFAKFLGNFNDFEWEF